MKFEINGCETSCQFILIIDWKLRQTAWNIAHAQGWGQASLNAVGAFVLSVYTSKAA